MFGSGSMNQGIVNLAGYISSLLGLVSLLSWIFGWEQVLFLGHSGSPIAPASALIFLLLGLTLLSQERYPRLSLGILLLVLVLEASGLLASFNEIELGIDRAFASLLPPEAQAWPRAMPLASTTILLFGTVALLADLTLFKRKKTWNWVNGTFSALIMALAVNALVCRGLGIESQVPWMDFSSISPYTVFGLVNLGIIISFYAWSKSQLKNAAILWFSLSTFMASLIATTIASSAIAQYDRTGADTPIEQFVELLGYSLSLVIGFSFILVHKAIASAHFNQRAAIELKNLSEAREIQRRSALALAGRLHIAFTESPIGMVILDLAGRISECNPSFAKMLGYQVEELIGRDIPSLSHPDDRIEDIDRIRGVLSGKIPYLRREKRYLHRNGNPVWVIVNANVLRSQNGTIEGIFAQIQDISALKEQEAQMAKLNSRLEQSLRTLSSFFESTSALMGVMDSRDGDIHHILDNKSATAFFGDSEKASERGLTKEQLDFWKTNFDIARESGRPHTVNFEVEKDGRPYFLHSTINYIGPSPEGGDRYSVNSIDVSREKAIEEDLRENQAILKSIFESSPAMMGIVEIEGDDIIWVYGNTAALKFMGRTQSDVVRSSTIPESRPYIQHSLSLYREAKRTGAPLHAELERVYHNQKYWLTFTTNYIGKGKSGLDRFSYMVFDITPRKQAEEKARLAMEAKSRFLANMSHEFRTPISGIIGAVDLLNKTSLSDGQKKLNKAIQSSAESLLALINDILDFSKADAGMLRLAKQPFRLRSVVDDTWNIIEFAARRKMLALNLEYDPRLPEVLKGDATKVRQILLNLLSNAVKFTEKGQVTLRLMKVNGRKKETGLYVEVEDSGIGISASIRDQLFQPFVQADHRSSPRLGGTGLGLAICKQLVENMEGEIGFESREGQGSKFWFKIYLQGGDIADLPRTKNLELVANSHFMGRALIVEDDETNRTIAELLLQTLGLETSTAGNGVEALELMKELRFDIVFMDCQMPVMNGYEATIKIRSLDGNGSNVPIIALTANAFQDDLEQCLKAGMSDYLSKPFRPHDIELILRKWLGQRHRTAVPS